MTLYDRAKAAAAVGMVFLMVGGIASAFVDMSWAFHLVLSLWFALFFPPIAMLFAPFIVKLVPVRNEDGRQFGPIGLVLALLVAVSVGIGLLVHVATF